ncbi:MAG: VIT1/CCC1 transporter family protein [Candidatus Nomurabacteria bacterium]|nr:MAG: VIT1/CCC1 transporter family protein [Candidatus Nomurabacteria bacterium]
MEQKITHASELLARRALQVQRGGARAAVLGVNDGLVSTLCLVIGVAATGAEAKAVLIAGFAGLLAGAISMAAGEWISVKAQVELFEGVLQDLKGIMETDGDLLAKNLAKNFEDHGIDAKSAKSAAADVSRDKKLFTSMYSSQVIGINDDELGSPWVAAVSSFLLFTAGSIAPLFPWMIGLHGVAGIMWAVGLTVVGGLLVGGYTARSSGKSVVYGAIRQLLIVVFASIVTYGIGHLFGVAIS